MSVRISKSGEHVQQGTVIYTADNENDIQSLPTTCTPGSTCFCIETSTTYILNNQGEWKVKSTAGGGGGGGGGGSAYPSADTREFPISNDNLTFTTQSKNYNDIVKAINEKKGTENAYSPNQMASAISEIKGQIPDYDITWSKNVLESWDFTKSLTGVNGNTFTITAGAARNENGIVFNGNAPTITCDLKNLTDDWSDVAFKLECDAIEWPNNMTFCIFGVQGHMLFEINGNQPWNQVFPRDYYTPTLNGMGKLIRNFTFTPIGIYIFNCFGGGSSSTWKIYKDLNDNIRDGDSLFCLGGYNNYLIPFNGFIIKSLEIYKMVEES